MLEKASAEIERLEKLNAQVITLEDDDYPDLLREIHDPPPILFVRGELQVTDTQQNVRRAATRMALCRCGHSGNKPFCDDSHYRVGFRSNDPQLDGGPDERSG